MPRPPSSAVARTLNRIVVGISGASGAIYGVRLLQALQASQALKPMRWCPTQAGARCTHECGVDGPTALQALAPGHQLHDVRNMGATLASGSFRSHAMVVAPCSMRTLAAIAHGLGDNLLTRAADVMLKERRKLVLMVRETPLHLVHLRNMTHRDGDGRHLLPAGARLLPEPAKRAKTWWTPAWPACSTSSTCPTPWPRAGPGCPPHWPPPLNYQFHSCSRLPIKR